MRRGFMLGVAACAIALSAQAATRQAGCYSGADIEAEQAIRFQTQVMVLSDICRDSTYTSFSQHVHEALAGYQRQMVAHFQRTGRGSGERVFDTFMTRLANEFSLEAGHQSVAELCQSSASLLATANGFNNSVEFKKYIVAQVAAPNRPQYVACK
jgi:hypothetical protein